MNLESHSMASLISNISTMYIIYRKQELETTPWVFLVALFQVFKYMFLLLIIHAVNT